MRNQTVITVVTVILCFIVLGTVLFLMGQVTVCECGYVKIWHGVTQSSENSQHISDWYSFSHVIHGFAFYWGMYLLRKRFGIPAYAGLILAVLLESSWEIFENTDLIINRYRAATISLDYFGDSILNSISDTVFMVAGYILAGRLPVWGTILLLLLMELFVGYWIRDNLFLNIVMLLFPVEAIKVWQSG